jgi:hypothetical protein
MPTEADILPGAVPKLQAAGWNKGLHSIPAQRLLFGSLPSSINCRGATIPDHKGANELFRKSPRELATTNRHQ